MTVYNLYDNNTDFKILLDTWVKEFVCPVPLVDLLLEQGQELPAEACRWAVNRKCELPIHLYGNYDIGTVATGAYPGITTSAHEPQRYFWSSMNPYVGHIHYSVFRTWVDGPEVPYFGTPADALLWLLYRWCAKHVVVDGVTYLAAPHADGLLLKEPK